MIGSVAGYPSCATTTPALPKENERLAGAVDCELFEVHPDAHSINPPAITIVADRINWRW
jgi:hypothetical protein